MKSIHLNPQRIAVNALKTAAILGTATAINAILLDRFQTMGNSSELYVLGVLLISLNTTGYLWGILGALAGVLCVNYFFTYPVVHGLLQLTHRGGQGVHQLPVGAGVQVDPAGGQNTFQISLGPHTASPPFSSGRRSYSSICRRTRRASAGLSKPGSARHCQFPPKVEGVFIRPSEPKPSRSCI